MKINAPLLKDGTLSKTRKVIANNRCGNPKTISIFTAIEILTNKNQLPINLRGNVEALIELRDNAIHFYNTDSISRPIQELGFACIKNYLSILKKWNTPIDVSRYNFYLMPLAYVDEKKLVESALTDEQQKYISLLKEKLNEQENNDDFDIAISITLDFKKGNSVEAIGMKYDPAGISVNISEEDIKKKYPHTYAEVIKKCKDRYIDFKCGKVFNARMKVLKLNDKIAYNRKLYPNNPKSQIATLYNGNIFQELDKFYTKK